MNKESISNKEKERVVWYMWCIRTEIRPYETHDHARVKRQIFHSGSICKTLQGGRKRKERSMAEDMFKKSESPVHRWGRRPAHLIAGRRFAPRRQGVVGTAPRGGPAPDHRARDSRCCGGGRSGCGWKMFRCGSWGRRSKAGLHGTER